MLLLFIHIFDNNWLMHLIYLLIFLWIILLNFRSFSIFRKLLWKWTYIRIVLSCAVRFLSDMLRSPSFINQTLLIKLMLFCTIHYQVINFFIIIVWERWWQVVKPHVFRIYVIKLRSLVLEFYVCKFEDILVLVQWISPRLLLARGILDLSLGVTFVH